MQYLSDRIECTLGVRLPLSLRQAAEAYAAEHDLTLSQVVRRGLKLAMQPQPIVSKDWEAILPKSSARSDA